MHNLHKIAYLSIIAMYIWSNNSFALKKDINSSPVVNLTSEQKSIVRSYNDQINIFVTNPIIADLLNNMILEPESIKVNSISCGSCMHHCSIKKKDLTFLDNANIIISLSEDEKDVIYPFTKTENFKNRYDLYKILFELKEQSIEIEPATLGPAKLSLVRFINSDYENDKKLDLSLDDFYLDLNKLSNSIHALTKVFDLYQIKYDSSNIMKKVNDIKQMVNENLAPTTDYDNTNDYDKNKMAINDKGLVHLANFLQIKQKAHSTSSDYKCIFISSHYNKVITEDNFVIIPEYNGSINEYLDNLNDALKRCYLDRKHGPDRKHGL